MSIEILIDDETDWKDLDFDVIPSTIFTGSGFIPTINIPLDNYPLTLTKEIEDEDCIFWKT